jgi:Ca2+-binding EF-hand superfamily protein
MNKRMQLSLALVLAAPAWLVAGYAVAQESPQTQQQMPQQQMQDQSGSQMMNMTAGEVAKLELKNDQGQEIGDIDKIVKSKTDGKLNAVVAVGGFLGLGEKKVAVPLDQLSYQQGELVAQGMTKDQLEQQQAYDDQQYDVVEKGTTLASAAGQAQTGQQQGLAFSDLDQNGDGRISRDEVRDVKQLAENWSQYDTNSDDALDQSEFSAFEQQQMQQQGDKMQQSGQSSEGGGMSGEQHGGGQVSFQQLDTDQDGNITQQEAESDPQLSQNFQQYDTDQNGQLDQSEFSAFEQQQGQPSGEMQQQPGQSSGGGGMSGGQQSTPEGQQY